MIDKKNLLKILALFFIFQSCDSKDVLKNPANYELFISISSDKDPAISPDGNSIAFYHLCLEYPEPENYPTGLYVMNSDGSNRKLLLKGNHWSPSWSPDGKWIVFTSSGVIQIINLEGNSIRTFQGINDVPLFYPNWSLNNRIIFSSPLTIGGGLFITDPYFKNAEQLFDTEKFSGNSPKWINNSSRIIYAKLSHEWIGGEIFIIDTLGIEDKRITIDKSYDRQPALSPDGNFIAVSRDVRIYIMDATGNNHHKLDYGQSPSWDPNSKYIIYSNANSDFTKEVLWKIDIDGKNKIQLTF